MDGGTTSSSRCVDLGTDVLVEILQRLPPNSRRRSRLVCRRWRDAVDERTATDLRSRAKTLLLSKGNAFVLDDNWRLKRVMASREGRVMEVVGTCNGLICLCDDGKPGGTIALANPANGERLVLPPLPCPDIVLTRGRLRWHEAYGFAHHQSTGRYKVVHVPCCFDRVWEFHTVQVFTLGEAAWRDVATPAIGGAGARCLRSAGIVSVDGATYWIAHGTRTIVSFDLEEERVSSVKPLPAPLPTRSGSGFLLAEVHGRLGVAIIHRSTTTLEEKTDVWVLESARGEQRWRRWYSVEMDARLWQRLTMPLFTHGNNKHVLLTRGDGRLYRHEPDGTRKRSRYGMVQISEWDKGSVVARGDVCGAFSYVETKEPLNIYRIW